MMLAVLAGICSRTSLATVGFAVAIVPMTKEFGWDSPQKGFALAAFFIGYVSAPSLTAAATVIVTYLSPPHLVVACVDYAASARRLAVPQDWWQNCVWLGRAGAFHRDYRDTLLGPVLPPLHLCTRPHWPR